MGYLELQLKLRRSGFTIVELLIVIVVIGILAAISIVAYNGIQNRSNDTTVKTDLANLAKAIEVVSVDSGSFPTDRGQLATSPGVTSGSLLQFPEVDFEPTKASYTQVPSGGSPNLIYCTGPHTASGQESFVLQAKSKSGQTFKYSSVDGMQEMGAQVINITNACSGIGYPQTRGYGYLNSSWYL